MRRALQTRRVRPAKNDSACEGRFAVQKKSIPTVQEETRFRPVRESFAVKKESAQDSTIRTCEEETFLRKRLTVKSVVDSELRRRHSVLTCVEESRRKAGERSRLDDSHL